MSIKKPSIAMIAQLIDEARGGKPSAQLDMVAFKLADFFKGQNQHFQIEPFLHKCGCRPHTIAGDENAVGRQEFLEPPQQEAEGQASLPSSTDR